MTTKILWFSRHSMTTEQRTALLQGLNLTEDTANILQVNGTAQNIHNPFEAIQPEGQSIDGCLIGTVDSLKALVAEFDVICAVLPINLLQQLLPLCPNGILQSENKRTFDINGKVQFVFEKWERIKRIEIIKEDL